MLSRLILTLVRTHSTLTPPPTPTPPIAPTHRNNFEAARKALVQSLFHAQGPPTFKKGRAAKQALGNSLANIEKLQAKLIAGREVREGEGEKAYVESYLQLQEGVSGVILNNEWIYRMVGWYNLTAFYPTLVDRLLVSREKELSLLIETLSWMKYNWGRPYGRIGPEDKAVQFYRGLALNLTLSELKKLETILITPIFYSKRRFFQAYLNHNLESILKGLNSSDGEQMTDLVWLYETWINMMNDNEVVSSRVEKYLLTVGVTLQDKQVEKLMEAYALKGRISKPFYNQFIRPHILKHKMGKIEGLVQAIRFLICSEAGDNALLKTLYEQISIQYREGRSLPSQTLYTLHLYTHYLRLRGYRIALPYSLEKLLNTFCKQRSEGRSSLSRYIHNNQVLRKKVADQKSKYYSDCLNTDTQLLREFESTNRSVFEQKFKNKLATLDLKNLRIYEKAVFCCFEMDFCLVGDANEQPIDIELEGVQYVFTSGRLIRQKEIRDEILTHYGFKINHLNYEMYKSKEKLAEEDFLLNTRVSDRDPV